MLYGNDPFAQVRFNNLYAQSMANQYGQQNMLGLAGGIAGSLGALQGMQNYSSQDRSNGLPKPSSKSEKKISSAYFQEGESVYESLKKHVEEWAK